MEQQNIKEGSRWLRQAEYDLKAAEWNGQGKFYAPACFMAQQSSAKSLRAFLFMNNEDARESRSVADLIDRAITYEDKFRFLSAKGARLDIYYKTSRFPDAIPGSIPAEVIQERDFKEAIVYASDILALVEEKRKSLLPETF